jgi:short-subunit dehydrogenase
VADLYWKLDCLQDLDICIVANNAGKAHANSLDKHSVEMIFNIINVNVNGVTFIARYYAEKFRARYQATGNRSALINVASIAAVGDGSQNTSVYAGSKAYDRLLSLSMVKEYSEFIDVLTVNPMSTKSSMNSGRYLGSISAAAHGRSVINTLGYRQTETFGHWYHGLQYTML